ncbi:IDEAL domain-containing protein [Lederbergia citrea]|uniref:IDEAL domain-containing protein n=1 Tax=Lederbergia citrea TaxID=2833581 RepID=A0A942Z418_9BACI|nr:IDEAL domain-containing protein [Lederbergia citrea]MBS4177441.1 IDEAL domain-containing protein [Lederbergia citrea]MBS4204119.1 IDEAL domain-containing protein [Lederbergia citrea]MBS4221296.1 IDEAL domain-containing protein [Lederbergia citrea]
MEKRKSYQELLKEYAMTQNQNEAQAMEWYVDFFLNGLLQQKREEKLWIDIDRALDMKDKEAFMKLSKELTNLIGQ